jgi:sulfite dehydrogenase (cytochrome) subunit A
LLSADGGRTWQTARLGHDYGNFSFRPWEAAFVPKPGRAYALQSLAINRLGETQRLSARWNAGGYLRNAVETITVQTTR